MNDLVLYLFFQIKSERYIYFVQGKEGGMRYVLVIFTLMKVLEIYYILKFIYTRLNNFIC